MKELDQKIKYLLIIIINLKKKLSKISIFT